MTNKELKAYVFEEKRQGRSESQIARSLGMSLAHFMGRLNGVNVDKVDPPKPKKTNAERAKDLGIKEAPVRKIEKQEVEHRRSIKESAFWGAEKPPVPVEEPKVEEKVEESPVAPVEDLSWMND